MRYFYQSCISIVSIFAVSVSASVIQPHFLSLDKVDRQLTMNKYQIQQKPSLKVLKERLKPVEYEVTQNSGTEPPFNNRYYDHKAEGIYVDIVSGEPLFSSTHKYDSGSGWPAFSQVIDFRFIQTKKDNTLRMKRTEVRYSYSSNHLGHVFDDGPGATGLRYCINSAALQFIPKEEMEEKGYGSFLFLFKK